jgi:hypothetical protein
VMVGPCAGGDRRGLEPVNASALTGEPIATSEGDPWAESVLERVDSFRPLLAEMLVDKGGARLDRSGVAVRRQVDPVVVSNRPRVVGESDDGGCSASVV